MEREGLREQQMLYIIKEKFPHISWDLVKVLENGRDNQVVILDDTIVFRFPRNDYVKDIHKKERHLLDLARDYVKTTIPKYEYLTDDHSVVGYKAIDGVFMSEEIYQTLPKEIQSHIQTQIGEFLTGLHSIPLDELEKIGYARKKGSSHIQSDKLKQDFRDLCSTFFTENELQTVLEYIDALHKMDHEPKVITHCDIQEKNILIDKDLTQITGIIDFSDAMIADPALDFDRLWDYGNEFVRGVYEAYQGNKDDDFLMRSKFYRKRILIYVIMDAVKNQYDVEKKLAEFRQEFFGRD